jgi:hypothetical protein
MREKGAVAMGQSADLYRRDILPGIISYRGDPI